MRQGYLFAGLVGLVFVFFTGSTYAATYVEPNLTGSLFDVSKTSITEPERELIATYLAGYVRSLDIGKDLNLASSARALGIALRIHPENRSAVVANAQLRMGNQPKPESGYKAQEAARYLQEISLRLQKQGGQDSAALATYLVVLASMMDAANEELIFSAETASKKNPPNWSFAVVNSPSAGEVAANTSVPSATPVSTVTKNQTKINGLVVMDINDTKVGQKMEIIATATFSGTAPTFVNTSTKIEEDMRISLDESLRAVLQKKPESRNGISIIISFDDKYCKKSGGSAGTAFALAIYSLLSNCDIDPNFCVTGDITVDGKTREIGGVSYKLRGAFLDKCKLSAIPAANSKEVGDMLLLQPRDGLQTLLNMQVFSVETLDDAIAIARLDRNEKLKKAIEKFTLIQTKLDNKINLSTLSNPEIQSMMSEVIALAPNHLSADYLLKISSGRAPEKITLNAGIQEVLDAMNSILSIFEKPEKSGKVIERYHFSSEDYREAHDRFEKIKSLLPAEVQDFYYASLVMMEAIEQYDNEMGMVPSYYRMQQYIQTLGGDARRRSETEVLYARINEFLEQYRKMNRDVATLEKRIR
jgi:hypothetical protein